jgi:hypothetical protein
MVQLTHDTDLDERARRAALAYAACTIHFVRVETVDWSFTDFGLSPLRPQVLVVPGHLGRPPIDIDRRAQQRFEQVVAARPLDKEFGQVITLGEEAGVPNWDPQGPGTATIIRCDPIDGTSALAHSAGGFSTVVTIEWRAGPSQRWRHYGGAIVRGDGLAISWSRRSVYAHSVLLNHRERLEPNERPKIYDLGIVPPLVSRDISEEQSAKLARSGAAVAAQSSERRRALMQAFPCLLADAEYFDLLAGTPSVWPLTKGMLGFVVEISHTTIHDSIHLFPFIELGGHVVDHHFHRINVKSLIEENAGPEAPAKVFPPYIAYVDDEALEFVKSCSRR